MRISDWSSDVCSSVLLHRDRDREMRARVEEVRGAVERIDDEARLARSAFDLARLFHLEAPARTRVGQFVIQRDRTSDLYGKSVSVRVDFGGRRVTKHKDINWSVIVKV